MARWAALRLGVANRKAFPGAIVPSGHVKKLSSLTLT